MNNALKLSLVGVGSFAAGAVTAYFVTRKAFATVAQEEIDSVHEMYAKHRKEESPIEAAERTLHQEELQKLRAKLSGEWSPDELSPANVTLNGEPVDPDEEQKPLSIFDEAENAEVARETAILNSLVAKRIPTEPYVVTIEDYHSDDWDHFDKEVLKYYEDPNGDHTLLDETDSIVPDIEGIIGDAADYFGIGSQDADIVYVRRESHSTDYEVHRIPMSYVEAVHNIDYDAIDTREVRRPLKMPREVE